MVTIVMTILIIAIPRIMIMIDDDDDVDDVVDTEHLAALATSGACSSNYSSTFIPCCRALNSSYFTHFCF